jgi:hypothetical protein
MAFIQQVETSSAGAPGSLTTGSITTTAGNLLVAVIQYDDLTTPTVTTTQAGGFTAIPGATADTGVGARIKIAAYYATANGGATTFTLTNTSTGLCIYVAEYSGGTIYLSGAGAGAYQNGPGLGANIITTGSVGGSGSVLLFGFSMNAQINATPAPSAGTSPTAFTGRTTVWATRNTVTPTGLPEDAIITGSGAATFGTVSGNQFNLFVTVAAAFSSTPPVTIAGPVPRQLYIMP